MVAANPRLLLVVSKKESHLERVSGYHSLVNPEVFTDQPPTLECITSSSCLRTFSSKFFFVRRNLVVSGNFSRQFGLHMVYMILDNQAGVARHWFVVEKIGGTSGE